MFLVTEEFANIAYCLGITQIFGNFTQIFGKTINAATFAAQLTPYKFQ